MARSKCRVYEIYLAKANSATTKPSGFFFLFSESMVPYVEQTDIQYGYRSDRSMIVLKFLFGKKIDETKNIPEI